MEIGRAVIGSGRWQELKRGEVQVLEVSAPRWVLVRSGN